MKYAVTIAALFLVGCKTSTPYMQVGQAQAVVESWALAKPVADHTCRYHPNYYVNIHSVDKVDADSRRDVFGVRCMNKQFFCTVDRFENNNDPQDPIVECTEKT